MEHVVLELKVRALIVKDKYMANGAGRAVVKGEGHDKVGSPRRRGNGP